jgi:hypothetical protein
VCPYEKPARSYICRLNTFVILRWGRTLKRYQPQPRLLSWGSVCEVDYSIIIVVVKKMRITYACPYFSFIIKRYLCLSCCHVMSRPCGPWPTRRVFFFTPGARFSACKLSLLLFGPKHMFRPTHGEFFPRALILG